MLPMRRAPPLQETQETWAGKRYVASLPSLRPTDTDATWNPMSGIQVMQVLGY